jgi:hypothetical protein
MMMPYAPTVTKPDAYFVGMSRKGIEIEEEEERRERSEHDWLLEDAEREQGRWSGKKG